MWFIEIDLNISVKISDYMGGKMIIKGVICPKCKDFIFSVSGNNFHYCSCRSIFIDGGNVSNGVLNFERIGFNSKIKDKDIIRDTIDLNFSRADILKELNFEYETRILSEEIYRKIKDINKEGKRVSLDELMHMMYPQAEEMPDNLTAYDIKDYMERAYKIGEIDGINPNKIYEAMEKNKFKFSPVALNDIAEKLELPFFTKYREMMELFIKEQENIYYNLTRESAIAKIKELAKNIYRIYPQKTIITIFINDCLERRGIIKKADYIKIF